MAFPWEPPRHYIDLDRYPTELPRSWKEATTLLTVDTLNAHGILPWHLEHEFWELVEAFRSQNVPRILKLSGEIGHYLGDAHVPLHTTSNYNGQLTGQQGVHGLWESLIPEQFGEGYDYWVGPARIWRSVRDTIWTIITESHALVPIVLSAEREATRRVGEEQKYTYRIRGRQTVRTYSERFLTVYHALLEGMVESRLRRAIHRLASLWLTAWHIAGRPPLPPYTTFEPEEEPLPDTLRPDPRCGELGCTLPSPYNQEPFIQKCTFPLTLPSCWDFMMRSSSTPLSRPVGVEWFASPYYHLLYAHRDDAEAEGFVQTLLERLSLPLPAFVLDAGCGEGRYARALARRGFLVDAVDAVISHPNLPEGVRFFQQDLRVWEPDRQYHLVGSFFTSLGIGMQRWDEVKGLVQRLARWTRPGGWLVIDYLNIYQRNTTSFEERVIQGIRFEIERWQDNFILYKRITVFDPTPQTFEERIFKLTEGDLYQMVERAGLEVRETWGDYHAAPFSAMESPRLIVIAQKPLS